MIKAFLYLLRFLLSCVLDWRILAPPNHTHKHSIRYYYYHYYCYY
jgi:hypothetical protein